MNQLLQIVGIALIVTAGIFTVLARGADEGWVTPFDDDEQRKTIWMLCLLV